MSQKLLDASSSLVISQCECFKYCVPDQPIQNIDDKVLADELTDSSLLEYGLVRVAQDEYGVFYNAEPIVLTKTEYEILQYLMQAPERVHSKAEITHKVRTYKDVGDHLAEVHIANLRRKFVAVGAPADIMTTVRGFGYKMKRT